MGPGSASPSGRCGRWGRRAEGLAGAVEVEPGAIVVLDGPVGEQGDGLLLPGDGGGEVAGLGLGGGERVEATGLPEGGELAGEVGGGDGAAAVAESGVGATGEDHGEVVVGLGVVGLEAGRLVVVIEGFPVSPAVGEGRAQPVVCWGRSGLKRIASSKSAIASSSRPWRGRAHAQAGVRLGEFGLEADRLLVLGDRLIESPLEVIDDPSP